MRDHVAATASRHRFAASARKIRSVERETRWRWRLKVLWTAACMLRNRWAEQTDLKRCILHSRRSHRLMRVFGSIVFAQPLLMRAVQSQTPERRSVRAQLVGDQQFGCEALLPEQLTHQPQRRPSVASAPDQHVEDLALVVH